MLLVSEQVPFLWYFQLIISLKMRLFHYVFEYVSQEAYAHEFRCPQRPEKLDPSGAGDVTGY